MASQQPSARPWFRLASMARPPSVPPPQPPQPRPSFVRPTFTQTFVTPTPQQTLQQQTTQEPLPPPPQTATQTPNPPPTTELPQPSQPMALTSPIAPPQAWTEETPLPHVASVPTSPIIKTTTPYTKSSPPLPLASSALPPSPNQITSFVPSSPMPTNQPPTKPVSPSPTPPTLPYPVLIAAPTATVIARVPTPTPSPKIDKLPQTPSPPHKIPSPRINTIAHPPSPLTLPPAQLKSDREHPNIPPEAEQKTILVHETIGITHKVHVRANHSPGIALNGKGDLTRDFKTNDNGDNHKKLYNSEEYGKRVITIAGENKGAIMELDSTSSSRKKHGFGGGNLHGLHMKGNLSGGKSGSEDRNSNKEEEMMKNKDKHETTAAISSPPFNAFMNSNVQGVNNSILFNCSCNHHDPGVHLSLSRNTNVAGIHGIQIKDSTNA